MPADGSTPTPLRPAVPRVPTSDECFDDFVEEATERTTATISELVDDRRVLQEVARKIAACLRDLEPLHDKLGEARAVSTSDGHGGTITTRGHMVDHDEYAIVEALFFDTLSGAAEKLLKAELREELNPPKRFRFSDFDREVKGLDEAEIKARIQQLNVPEDSTGTEKGDAR